MLKKHSPLITLTIKKFNIGDNPLIGWDDLFSVGLYALLKAIRTFDESKGIQFSTYAGRCIWNQMAMYIKRFRFKGFTMYLEDIAKEDFEGNSASYKEVLSDNNSNLALDEIDLQDVFREDNLTKILTNTERKILTYLLTHEPTQQRNIAEELNVTQPYVCKSIKRIQVKMNQLIYA